MNAPDKIYLTPLLVEGCGKTISKRVTENDAVYIREDLIKAEIERLMDEYKPVVGGTDELTGAHIVLAKLLSFISTPENKSARQRLAEWSKTPEGRESYEKVAEEMRREISEKQTNQDGLEEEINRYLEPIHAADIQFEPFTQMTKCARHFAQWQKEQMMEGAISCNVFWHDGPLLDYTQEQQDNALERIGANVGDKVKIIIVKED